MNETNNTNGGPGTEAKAPHVIDFKGTAIAQGLWAIEVDELQRVGNAAYQLGRSERDAEAKRVQAANEALSARVEQLREALEASHQLLRTKAPSEGEVAQLREALKLASQDQASVATALRCEPGERVEDTVRAVAGILRKTCAVLGIHDEDATDIPGMVSKLCSLRAEVVKAFGEGADEHFGVVHARRIDDEVERATRRIDAARLRAVADLDFERSDFAARRNRVIAETEVRVRKACADQINAAQACIDRATKEHEAERVELNARIAEVEKQRDGSREAHNGTLAVQTKTVEALRNCREKLAKEREAMRVLVFNLRTITLANREEGTLAAVQRVVAERDAALRATQLRSVDIFGRDGIRIGDIVCTMPAGTFSVGP